MAQTTFGTDGSEPALLYWAILMPGTKEPRASGTTSVRQQKLTKPAPDVSYDY